MREICMFHVKDTKWGKNPANVDIHTICVDLSDDSFAMFDVAVNKGHQFNENSVDNIVRQWKPVLKSMGVKGTVELYGVEFPKTTITIKR
jgi:hypothetical protein